MVKRPKKSHVKIKRDRYGNAVVVEGTTTGTHYTDSKGNVKRRRSSVSQNVVALEGESVEQAVNRTTQEKNIEQALNKAKSEGIDVQKAEKAYSAYREGKPIPTAARITDPRFAGKVSETLHYDLGSSGRLSFKQNVAMSENLVESKNKAREQRYNKEIGEYKRAVSGETYDYLIEQQKLANKKQTVVSEAPKISDTFNERERRVEALIKRDEEFFNNDGFKRINELANIITFGKRRDYEDRSFLGKVAQNVVGGTMSFPIATGGQLASIGGKVAAFGEAYLTAPELRKDINKHLKSSVGETIKLFDPTTPEGVSIYVGAATFGLIGVKTESVRVLNKLAKQKPESVKFYEYQTTKTATATVKNPIKLSDGEISVTKPSQSVSTKYTANYPAESFYVIKGKSTTGLVTPEGTTYTNTKIVYNGKNYMLQQKISPEGIVQGKLFRGEKLLKTYESKAKPNIVFNEPAEVISTKQNLLQAPELTVTAEKTLYSTSTTSTTGLKTFKKTTVPRGKGAISVEETLIAQTTKPKYSAEIGKDSAVFDIQQTKYNFQDNKILMKPKKIDLKPNSVSIETPASTEVTQNIKRSGVYKIDYETRPSALKTRINQGLNKRGSVFEDTLTKTRNVDVFVDRSLSGIKSTVSFPDISVSRLSSMKLPVAGSIISLQPKTMKETKTKAVSNVKNVVETKIKPIIEQKPETRIIQKPKIEAKIRQEVKPIQETKTRTITDQAIVSTGFGKTPNINIRIPKITRPRTPILFKLDTAKGFSRIKQRKFIKQTQAKGYTPSLTARVFSIRGTEGKLGTTTGLGLRPIGGLRSGKSIRRK